MAVEIGTVCFSHGQESGPWGSKIKRLAKVAERCGFAVESIDYRGIGDPDERVAKLLDWQPSVDGRLAITVSWSFCRPSKFCLKIFSPSKVDNYKPEQRENYFPSNPAHDNQRLPPRCCRPPDPIPPPAEEPP